MPEVSYMPITGRTRAGANGKRIMCPICEKSWRVAHFGWNTLVRLFCHNAVDKAKWLFEMPSKKKKKTTNN